MTYQSKNVKGLMFTGEYIQIQGGYEIIQKSSFIKRIQNYLSNI